MELEKLTSYKIVIPHGSLFFYPETQQMVFEYYNEVDDEEYEILVWDSTGFYPLDFTLDGEKYLAIFKEYEEKDK